jgi:hypothetical protein
MSAYAVAFQHATTGRQAHRMLLPSQPPPWTGEEPRLPPCPRGGLGWGARYLNLYA